MTPLDWAVRPFRRYAVFSGRAPRAEYWWFYLATIIVQIPLTVIDSMLGSWSPFSSIFSLATLFPSLAVTVRRLHDINRSGWWLLGLIAAFGPIGVILAIDRAGQFAVSGPASLSSAMIAMIVLLVALITLLVFMVSPGTDGPNLYGPDPYGPDDLEEVFA